MTLHELNSSGDGASMPAAEGAGGSPCPDRDRASPRWILAAIGALGTLSVLACLGLPRVGSPSRPPAADQQAEDEEGELATIAGLRVGQPAPPLVAQGWVNGEPPADLSGKVVVVESWAPWCGPCKQKAPYLVALHRRFTKQGVVFIGLTGDDAGEIRKIREFVDTYGITWPNGYGAEETLARFSAEAFPLAWVIGPDGRIAWNVASASSLEDAIKQALAQSRP